MLDGAVVIPIQTMLWNLLFELAALLWMVVRALLSVGYFILTLTGWLTQNVFAPLLSVVGEQTQVLVAPLFLIAITILGFTYLMAVFGRFEVVNFRSAVLWLLFAATLYTFGPNLYTGLEDFRRLVGGGFYDAGIDAFSSASGATGLNAIGTMAEDSVSAPTDQFGQFLPGVPGASAVDGLDVAMAYIDADGYDVLAASGSPHPIARLPWNIVAEGSDGYFDPDTGPAMFNSMTDADRQASIGRALQGVWRTFTTIFIGIFGIIEQLINFLMAASFAVAFFSMFVAVLFGFFIRTEPIAWGAFNLIIELFIQSIINSLLMSLILGFVMVGANTANAILLLGASLVGLWLSWNLLQSAIRGLTNSSERLYKSFSASTGGNFVAPSETNQAMGSAVTSAATGASVLAGGGSFLQAMGATFGDDRTAQTMNYASRMLGGEDTLLGSMAQSIGEGASARSLAGPVGGYLLGKQSNDQRQRDRAAQTRRNYRGENDQARDAALDDYADTGDEDALDEAFSPEDKPRVQALRDTFEPDDFDTVVDAVRNVRNDNPSLPPQSPAFTSRVREQLPSPLKEMEAPALDDFAQVFGKPADNSAYQASLDMYLPSASAVPTLGNADFTRDDAVSDYRQAQQSGASLPSMEDAFSPDDANRVAQLIDAYDDDDFAQAVYAVRAARQSNPDAATGSPQALQATRQNLPPRLQNMPSNDLAAFSKAFGGSATTPVQPSTYIGEADQARDAALADYRSDPDNFDSLADVFSKTDARDVETLSQEYPEDDFDAVVRAVRQARTADPEMEAGSPFAVRATRKLLPENLRQMPSRDLTAFSRTFGAPADNSNIREYSKSERELANTRANRRKELLGNPASSANLDIPVPIQSADENLGIPAPIQSADENLGIPEPAQTSTPLQPMRNLGGARLQKLADMGITTMEGLRDASPWVVATALRVADTQVEQWQQQATTAIEAGNLAVQAGSALANGQPDLPNVAEQASFGQQSLPNTNIESVSLTSDASEMPTAVPTRGRGNSRRQRLAQQSSMAEPVLPTQMPVQQGGISMESPLQQGAPQSFTQAAPPVSASVPQAQAPIQQPAAPQTNVPQSFTQAAPPPASANMPQGQAPVQQPVAPQSFTQAAPPASASAPQAQAPIQQPAAPQTKVPQSFAQSAQPPSAPSSQAQSPIQQPVAPQPNVPQAQAPIQQPVTLQPSVPQSFTQAAPQVQTPVQQPIAPQTNVPQAQAPVQQPVAPQPSAPQSFTQAAPAASAPSQQAQSPVQQPVAPQPNVPQSFTQAAPSQQAPIQQPVTPQPSVPQAFTQVAPPPSANVPQAQVPIQQPVAPQTNVPQSFTQAAPQGQIPIQQPVSPQPNVPQSFTQVAPPPSAPSQQAPIQQPVTSQPSVQGQAPIQQPVAPQPNVPPTAASLQSSAKIDTPPAPQEQGDSAE